MKYCLSYQMFMCCLKKQTLGDISLLIHITNVHMILFLLSVSWKHRGGSPKGHRSGEGCCEEAEGKASPHSELLWPEEWGAFK